MGLYSDAYKKAQKKSSDVVNDESNQENDAKQDDSNSEEYGTVTAIERDEIIVRLRADKKGNTAVSCFGGVLFRSTNESDLPIMVFAVKDVEKDILLKLDAQYKKWNRHKELPFLVYEKCYEIGSEAFFIFSISDNTVSLRDMLKQAAFSDKGIAVFNELIIFLKQYSNLWLETKYQPLCCLSLDTVFITTQRNIYDLNILPIKAVGNRYPAYYPGEVYDGNADISSDMYTAALVGIQLLSGKETEIDGARMSACNDMPCMRECVAPFKSWRPTMEATLLQLKNSAFDKELGAQQNKNGKDKFIEVTPMEDENEDNDNSSVSDDKKRFKLPEFEFFKKILNSIKNLLSKLKLDTETLKEPEDDKSRTVVHIGDESIKKINIDDYEND